MNREDSDQPAHLPVWHMPSSNPNKSIKRKNEALVCLRSCAGSFENCLMYIAKCPVIAHYAKIKGAIVVSPTLALAWT